MNLAEALKRIDRMAQGNAGHQRLAGLEQMGGALSIRKRRELRRLIGWQRGMVRAATLLGAVALLLHERTEQEPDAKGLVLATKATVMAEAAFERAAEGPEGMTLGDLAHTARELSVARFLLAVACGEDAVVEFDGAREWVKEGWPA